MLRRALCLVLLLAYFGQGMLHARHASITFDEGPHLAIGYATSIAPQFENGLALVGYHVDTTSLPPTDNLLHPPSNWLHVTTYWQMRGDMAKKDALDPAEFGPFVHLVGAQGGVWGGDLPRPPTVFHRDPPAQWGAETIVEAHYDVNLNPVTPPGTYRLLLGLIDANGAPILTAAGAHHVELTPIEITP